MDGGPGGQQPAIRSDAGRFAGLRDGCGEHAAVSLGIKPLGCEQAGQHYHVLRHRWTFT
ncbi:hypothetical protein D3C87_1085620 [compost metagenome]